MKIIVNFLNGSQYWRNRVLASAEAASRALSDPRFLDSVRAIPHFDFTSDMPAQVGDKIEAAGDVRINVRFYWNPFSRAIAKEGGGTVSFNTCKRGAGSVENVAHEVMHAPPLDYEHRGNSASGNENTVPYLVGQMVGQFVREAS